MMQQMTLPALSSNGVEKRNGHHKAAPGQVVYPKVIVFFGGLQCRSGIHFCQGLIKRFGSLSHIPFLRIVFVDTVQEFQPIPGTWFINMRPVDLETYHAREIEGRFLEHHANVLSHYPGAGAPGAASNPQNGHVLAVVYAEALGELICELTAQVISESAIAQTRESSYFRATLDVSQPRVEFIGGNGGTSSLSTHATADVVRHFASQKRLPIKLGLFQNIGSSGRSLEATAASIVLRNSYLSLGQLDYAQEGTQTRVIYTPSGTHIARKGALFDEVTLLGQPPGTSFSRDEFAHMVADILIDITTTAAGQEIISRTIDFQGTEAQKTYRNRRRRFATLGRKVVRAVPDDASSRLGHRITVSMINSVLDGATGNGLLADRTKQITGDWPFQIKKLDRLQPGLPDGYAVHANLPVDQIQGVTQRALLAAEESVGNAKKQLQQDWTKYCQEFWSLFETAAEGLPLSLRKSLLEQLRSKLSEFSQQYADRAAQCRQSGQTQHRQLEDAFLNVMSSDAWFSHLATIRDELIASKSAVLWEQIAQGLKQTAREVEAAEKRTASQIAMLRGFRSLSEPRPETSHASLMSTDDLVHAAADEIASASQHLQKELSRAALSHDERTQHAQTLEKLLISQPAHQIAENVLERFDVVGALSYLARNGRPIDDIIQAHVDSVVPMLTANRQRVYRVSIMALPQGTESRLRALGLKLTEPNRAKFCEHPGEEALVITSFFGGYALTDIGEVEQGYEQHVAFMAEDPGRLPPLITRGFAVPRPFPLEPEEQEAAILLCQLAVTEQIVKQDGMLCCRDETGVLRPFARTWSDLLDGFQQALASGLFRQSHVQNLIDKSLAESEKSLEEMLRNLAETVTDCCGSQYIVAEKLITAISDFLKTHQPDDLTEMLCRGGLIT